MPSLETQGFHRYRRRAIAAYLVMLVAVATLLASIQAYEYRTMLNDGRAAALGRAALAAEWVSAVFRLSDMALDGLEELNRAPRLGASDETVDPDYERLEALLAERRDRFHFLDELGLFDAVGRVVVTSSPIFPRGYDLGGLPHYRIFREQPGLQEWVSGLYWSAFANDHRIMHVRRLPDDGELPAAFAANMLTPQVFEEALARLPMGQGESLMMVDDQAQLIMRLPRCDMPSGCWTIGLGEAGPSLDNVIDPSDSTLIERAVSPLDGVERLYASANVEGRPYSVVAGISVAVLLDVWWQQLWVRSGILLLVALLGAGVLRHYLRRLRLEEEARVAATAFEGQQGMWVSDAEGAILRVNAAFTRITGYPERAVLGRLPNLLLAAPEDDDVCRRIWQTTAQEGSWDGEVWQRRRNGERFPAQLLVSAVHDAEGRIVRYVGALSDISRQKAAEDQAQRLALYDPLTGLPNRRHLLDKLSHLTEENLPGYGYAALLLIDMDHFKRVNDLLGHEQGDLLLQRITYELGQQVRESDTLSRLSGDEFAAVLERLGPDLGDAALIVERIAAKLLSVLQHSLSDNAHSLQVTASIGISLFPLGHGSPEALMQEADMALNQAKEAGRNGFVFFDPVQQRLQRSRMLLELDMREAAGRGQFQLYCQRQVDAQGAVLGAEVLLRWEHPQRGMVSPAEFIPLAEDNRQIIAIDHWVLESACLQLSRFAERPETQALTLAVNISTLQFREADFVDQVRQMLDETGAPPHRLKLEVTEGSFLERPDEARETMLALKALGITFALDDFGTGFSSLAYLNRLPLDQLKIDQSFVSDLPDDPASDSIVASTIALAHSLGLEVIAEGVESEAQRAWLEEHGCLMFQGYLFGRPQPLDEFETALRD